jgi:hypothetical protein
LHQICQVETRGKRQNYFALNDGYDSETLPEDQLSSPIPGSLSLEITDVRSCLQNQSCNLHQFQDQPLSIPLIHIYPRKTPCHQLMTRSLRKGHGFGTTLARPRFPMSGMKRRSGD